MTANDRFKAGFGRTFWNSLTLAVLLTWSGLMFGPTIQATDISRWTEPMTTIDIPDELDIPAPPEQIARPAMPVMSDAVVNTEITIEPTTPQYHVLPIAPPPGADRPSSDSSTRQFTPMTVPPELINKPEVERALMRSYPPLLRDAGIGGGPVLWFFIDENGKVLKTQVSRSSGYPALDQAAIDVSGVMKFTPAWNRDKKVPVWVEIPIRFSVK